MVNAPIAPRSGVRYSCMEAYGWSHLDFVDRVVYFLAPHRDAVLAVSVDPAILTETLRLEAGKCPVVRNSHGRLSRHGRQSGYLSGPAGPKERRTDRRGTSADAVTPHLSALSILA